MKIIKIKLVMVLLTCTFSLSTLWAQSPEKMSYQAVIRNSSNQLVTNTQIGMKISVLKGSATGTPVYVETKTPTTNANGLVSIEIGGGVGFDTINWSNDTYFIKTETAVVAPLTTYTITGVSQLLSVPYALHAKTAEGITGGIIETDPVFAAHPANGITATDVTNWNNKLSTEIDGSVTNEIQALSISNDTIYLSNGGFVKLPAGFNGQYGSLTGTPTIPTTTSQLTNNSGFLTLEVDGSVTNEIQALSISNDTIYLSNGGFVKLPAGFDGQYSSLTGTPTIPTTTSQLTNNSGFLTLEVDGSVTNEIQALSISNDTIYLSNGGFVKLQYSSLSGKPTLFDGNYNSLSNLPTLNIANWNTAYGWGNHAGLYRPIAWVPAWTDVTGKPTFATVATSGSYTDLTNKPVDATITTSGFMGGADKTKLNGIATGAEVNVNADWNQTTTTADDYIKNKPTIPTTTSQLTNNSGFLTSEVDGSVTNEIQALSISNDTIYLSNGGFVKLPSANGSETKVTAGINVTVTGAGTTASPYVIGETPGTVAGQMKYWNGTSWVTVARGSYGQVLTSINGIPTWGGIPSVGTNEVQNPITGAIWMDRNLGATQVATNSTDAAAYGYLYQWGRGTDGHQIRTSGITPTLSNSDTVGHGNFITSSDWRSPKNDNLWQGVSGTNNPCPSGYRLPTDAEWDTERLSWSSDNSAGAFASPLKLPMAGIRYNTNGLLSDAGANGHYWSSTVSGIYARRLSFTNIHSDMGIGNRAWGFSVRCIKD